MKKFLAGLMIICMLGSFALADSETYVSGRYEYEILEDGTVELCWYDEREDTKEYTLVLPGELDGTKIDSVGRSIGSFSEYIAHVVIPEGIESIAKKAFRCAKVLKTVDIADTVVSIGEKAFEDCELLRQVFIPASVTEIGEGAFLDCPELILMVEEGSYAEQYAIENGLKYVY